MRSATTPLPGHGSILGMTLSITSVVDSTPHGHLRDAEPQGMAWKAGGGKGISSIRLEDERGLSSAAIRYSVSGEGAGLSRILLEAPSAWRFVLAMGNPTAPGVPSAEAAAGLCGEWASPVSPLECQFRKRQKGKIRELSCWVP